MTQLPAVAHRVHSSCVPTPQRIINGGFAGCTVPIEDQIYGKILPRQGFPAPRAVAGRSRADVIRLAPAKVKRISKPVLGWYPGFLSGQGGSASYEWVEVYSKTHGVLHRHGKPSKRVYIIGHRGTYPYNHYVRVSMHPVGYMGGCPDGTVECVSAGGAVCCNEAAGGCADPLCGLPLMWGAPPSIYDKDCPKGTHPCPTPAGCCPDIGFPPDVAARPGGTHDVPSSWSDCYDLCQQTSNPALCVEVNCDQHLPGRFTAQTGGRKAPQQRPPKPQPTPLPQPPTPVPPAPLPVPTKRALQPVQPGPLPPATPIPSVPVAKATRVATIKAGIAGYTRRRSRKLAGATQADAVRLASGRGAIAGGTDVPPIFPTYPGNYQRRDIALRQRALAGGSMYPPSYPSYPGNSQRRDVGRDSGFAGGCGGGDCNGECNSTCDDSSCGCKD